MITLEQKLSQFRTFVDNKIDEEVQSQIREKQEEVNNYIDSETRKIQQELKETEKNALQRIKRQKQEKLSILIQRERREYLKKSESCLASLMEKVKDQCYDFVKGEQYIRTLRTLLEKTLDAEENLTFDTPMEIALNPSCFQEGEKTLLQVLQDRGYKNVKISRGSLLTIGGFVLEAPEKHIRITKTLESSLEMKRKEIGQFLSDYIREGGIV